MAGAERVRKANGADGLFAVTVEFRLRPGATQRFRALVLENAATWIGNLTAETIEITSLTIARRAAFLNTESVQRASAATDFLDNLEPLPNAAPVVLAPYAIARFVE